MYRIAKRKKKKILDIVQVIKHYHIVDVFKRNQSSPIINNQIPGGVMSPQIGPASSKPINRWSLQTSQNGLAGLEVSEDETLVGGVDKSRHDPGPHSELLDRQDLTDGQTGDSVAEGDPRAQIRRVARRFLMDQHLDLGRGDAHEQIAIDHRQLRGQNTAVQVPRGDAEIHSQQPPQLRRASFNVHGFVRHFVLLAPAIHRKHTFQKIAGFSHNCSFGFVVLH